MVLSFNWKCEENGKWIDEFNRDVMVGDVFGEHCRLYFCAGGMCLEGMLMDGKEAN